VCAVALILAFFVLPLLGVGGIEIRDDRIMFTSQWLFIYGRPLFRFFAVVFFVNPHCHAISQI